MEFTCIGRKEITGSDYSVNASQGNARIVSANLRICLCNIINVYILPVAMSIEGWCLTGCAFSLVFVQMLNTKPNVALKAIPGFVSVCAEV